MLVLTRRCGETILVGDDITITVTAVCGNKVRVGVEAPRGMVIDREEIRQRRNAGWPAKPARPGKVRRA